MTILTKLLAAGKYSYAPVYSLFRTDSEGNYTLILRTNDAAEIDAEYFRECISALFELGTGLEVRCNGCRISV